MTATVLAFPDRRPIRPEPRRYPIAPSGGDVYVSRTHGSCFTVYDESPSGGSAGLHGDFERHADAVAEGRRIAKAINGTFHDLTEGGTAA